MFKNKTKKKKLITHLCYLLLIDNRYINNNERISHIIFKKKLNVYKQ